MTYRGSLKDGRISYKYVHHGGGPSKTEQIARQGQNVPFPLLGDAHCAMSPLPHTAFLQVTSVGVCVHTHGA